MQDVRSANNMNDATQPQHFTLRTGSSTSGSPASSRASSQSGFRVQAQSNNTPRPFSEPRGPAPVPAELTGELQFRAPEPASAQLCTDWTNSFCTILRHKNAILPVPMSI